MAISYTKTSWVNGQAPALNANNLNKIENGIYNATTEVNGKYSKPSGGIPSSDMASAVQSALTLANSSMQIDLLWENSSYTSSYSGGTITTFNKPLSNYGAVLIISKSYTTSGYFSSDIGLAGKQMALTSISGVSVSGVTVVATARRDATINTSSIVFSNGLGPNNENNPNFCVPYRVYGIKGVN